MPHTWHLDASRTRDSRHQESNRHISSDQIRVRVGLRLQQTFNHTIPGKSVLRVPNRFSRFRLSAFFVQRELLNDLHNLLMTWVDSQPHARLLGGKLEVLQLLVDVCRDSASEVFVFRRSHRTPNTNETQSAHHRGRTLAAGHRQSSGSSVPVS